MPLTKAYEIRCMCNWKCSAPTAISAISMFAAHHTVCKVSPAPETFQIVSGYWPDTVRKDI